MKLFSTVFPKDDSIPVLETLSTNCNIQIQKTKYNSSNDIPFLSESTMLQELLTNLSEIESELEICNSSLKLSHINEEQSRFLANQTKSYINETSMTKFLQEKKNQISRILTKIKNDSGVIHKLRHKIRNQVEFITLMQSIYHEFNQDHNLFSEGAPESSLRNSLRGTLTMFL
jgi:hypothetical protein